MAENVTSDDLHESMTIWYVTWHGKQKKSWFWSWRSSEVTFSVMVRSNVLQFVENIERSNTEVITFHLICHLTCDTQVTVVVMEVIWGHVFSHGEVKWPQICLKHWKVEYWSKNLSLDMSWHGIRKRHLRSWRSSEVTFTVICLRHWKVEYWSHYFSFDMSHDMGYAKVNVVVMEVIWGHIFGHGEVKWPPIYLKHWKVEYWSHNLSFDMSLAMVFLLFIFLGPQEEGG